MSKKTKIGISAILIGVLIVVAVAFMTNCDTVFDITDSWQRDTVEVPIDTTLDVIVDIVEF